MPRRLDSERENERSCVERRGLSRLVPELRRSRRRDELKGRDDDRVMVIRRGHSASHVLSDQRVRARRDVRAAVLRRDTPCAGRICVLARASRRGVRVTPDRAQQRSVGPRQQCQHDRKDSCSEHVDCSSAVSGKTRASGAGRRRAEIVRFLTCPFGPADPAAGIRRGVAKIPRCQERSSARV